MKAKKWMVGIMIAIVEIVTGVVAVSAEEIYGKVSSVNTQAGYLCVQRTLYPAGRTEEMVIAVPQNAKLQGVASLAEIKPGDDVKLEASQDLLSNKWTAKAVAPGKEPERGEIFYGKITYVDMAGASLRMRIVDRETSRVDEMSLNVPSTAQFKNVHSLKDLKVGDEIKVQAHRGLLPYTGTVQTLELGRGPEKGEFLYGKITALNTAASTVRMQRRDPEKGITEEIILTIPDSVQLKGIKTLSHLKIGDEVKIEATKNLFLGTWTANYIEPGTEPKGGDAIFGKVTSVDVAAVLVSVQRENPDTGNLEELAITVPRTAQLRGFDSLMELKPGDEVRIQASKDLFSNARTAVALEPSRGANTAGQPVLQGTICCVGVNGETLHVQRTNPYSGKEEDFLVSVPRAAQIKGVKSVEDLKSGDQVRIQASKSIFSGIWVASTVEYIKNASAKP